MLLSDKDIRAEVDAGRVVLDPCDSAMVQPSSTDVRLDKDFRRDPGFRGHVTLEPSNVATLPILLYHGMKIGQLGFFRLSSACERPYGSGQSGSHYQDQRGPTASRSFRNFHRTKV